MVPFVVECIRSHHLRIQPHGTALLEAGCVVEGLPCAAPRCAAAAGETLPGTVACYLPVPTCLEQGWRPPDHKTSLYGPPGAPVRRPRQPQLLSHVRRRELPSAGQACGPASARNTLDGADGSGSCSWRRRSCTGAPAPALLHRGLFADTPTGVGSCCRHRFRWAGGGGGGVGGPVGGEPVGGEPVGVAVGTSAPREGASQHYTRVAVQREFTPAGHEGRHVRMKRAGIRQTRRASGAPLKRHVCGSRAYVCAYFGVHVRTIAPLTRLFNKPAGKFSAHAPVIVSQISKPC
jgi:hypothetical protein